MKILSVVIPLLILLSSCDKKECDLPADTNSGLIVSSFDIDNNCVRLDEFKDFYVIRTRQEYDSLKITKSSVDSCSTYNLNANDFEKYTLLGFKESGTCQVSYSRKVIENFEDKKYIYSIVVNECGDCEKLSFSMNWVLVPKIPEAWTVEFLKE